MNELVTISVVFPKTGNHSLEDIFEWKEQFEEKITFDGLRYDRDWTEEKSRVEFTGTFIGGG